MKRFLIATLFLCAIANCSHRSYDIKGEITGVDGRVVLSYSQPVSKEKICDTVDIENGCFIFKGVVEDVVKVSIEIISDKGEKAQGRFYLENAPLLLNLDWDSVVDQGHYGRYIEKIEISGGVNSEFMKEFESVRNKVLEQDKYKEYKDAVEKLETYNQYTEYDKYKGTLDKIGETFADQIADLRRETIAATIDFIKANPDAECAADIFSRYLSSITLDEMEDVFNNFTPKVQNCYLAKEVKEEITALKSVQPGAVAPDFTLKTPDGTDFTLSSLRGKYVLVDFWASWCGPCRASIPHLKEIYAKYKDKGFEIVGVTNDTNHDSWKKAIEEDQSPWIHVADVFPKKYSGAEVIARYAAHYLPTLYLIDKEGKMIGKIEHTELGAKLKELFGE